MDNSELVTRARELKVPGYRRMTKGQLERAVKAAAPASNGAPRKGRSTRPALELVQNQVSPAPVKGRAQAPRKGRTTSAPAVESKAQKTAPSSTGTAAQGEAKRPTRPEKVKVTGRVRAGTGVKGRVPDVPEGRVVCRVHGCRRTAVATRGRYAKLCQPHITEKVAAERRARPEPEPKSEPELANGNGQGDAGTAQRRVYNSIDNENVDWDAEWGGGQRGNRSLIMPLLREYKGDNDRVFRALKRKACGMYRAKKTDKQAAERQLRWHIARTKFDFVVATDQHMTGPAQSAQAAASKGRKGRASK